MLEAESQMDFDAVIIGAGFGGLYMLHKLRDELGLNVLVLERGEEIGGTWYWNQYPGAKSDTNSHIYRYSFDNEGSWENSYVTQPEVLRYIQDVALRYDFYRNVMLNTEITSAHFDEENDVWSLTTDTGKSFTARWLVTAVGLLSRTNLADIPGRDTFAGELIHTGAWPKDTDISGKRVGLIGTGSSGVQTIPAAAPHVEHLTVFQRTAQYVVPSGKYPVDASEIEEVKANYSQIWQQVRNSQVGFGFEESTTPTMSVSAEERQRVFQENWEKGNGFRFMFGTFADIATDRDANDAATSFIRSKIAEIVDDPETARKLSPTDLFAKRPLCTENYYETFNRDNVSLVDIKENPISTMTPNGIRTEDGVEHALDMIIFATGFDAVDGTYRQMDLRGRDGQHINEHWRDGPTGYLGISVNKFPNMFMILGPNGPFSNLLPGLEVQVEWISDTIKHAEQNNATIIEATSDAEQQWQDTCQEIADQTLFPKAHSWIFGGNVPDKKMAPMFYLGGLGPYGQQLAEEAKGNYPGFNINENAAVNVPL